MKKRFAVLLVLFTLHSVALAAQTASKPAEKTYSQELTQFRAFIEQHPRALAELKQDPALISSPDFAKSHRVVGQYLADHPKVKDEVKANPGFFEGITAKRQGGGKRGPASQKKP